MSQSITIENQIIESLSVRQREVLTAALDLVVEMGDAFTMNAVASRANCSKETLYKWFGDREGLLTATVQWQASKVKIAWPDKQVMDQASYIESLVRFAESWLQVLSGKISIALNRLAVSHEAAAKGLLGSIVLKNGLFAIAERLKPLLEMGRDANFLKFNNSDEAFRCFFGLVVRDMQIRTLLGDEKIKSAVDARKDAKRAVEQFFVLYGTSTDFQRK